MSSNAVAAPSAPLMCEVLHRNLARAAFSKAASSLAQRRAIKLFTGTWNVNGQPAPRSGDLREWLAPADAPAGFFPEAKDGRERRPSADIYVIGFQEIVELNPQAMLLDAPPDPNAVQWQRLVEETLGPAYQRIFSHQLVGVCLLVFVRLDLLPHVSNVQFDSVGVGILGVGGNKGGIAVRLQVFDTTLCFINSHLATGQDPAARNAGYHALVKELRFSTEKVSSSSSRRPGHGSMNASINITAPSPAVTPSSIASALSPAAAAIATTTTTTTSNPISPSSSGSSTTAIATPAAAAPPPNSPHLSPASPASPSSSSSSSSSSLFGALLPQPDQPCHAAAVLRARTDKEAGEEGSTLDIFDHEHVFWIGDQNYRLNIKDAGFVFQRIRERDWATLVAFDQLRREMAAGRAFVGFTEPEIHFAPTYKYRVGSSLYAHEQADVVIENDQAMLGVIGRAKSSLSTLLKKTDTQEKEVKKARVPAWCDRILYKSRPRATETELQEYISQLEAAHYDLDFKARSLDASFYLKHMHAITQLALTPGENEPALPRCINTSYNRVERFESDHRPVYATFLIYADVIDDVQQRVIYEEVTKRVRLWAAQYISLATLLASDAAHAQERRAQREKQQQQEGEKKKKKGAAGLIRAAGGALGAAGTLTGELTRSLTNLSLDEEYIQTHLAGQQNRVGFLRGAHSLGLGVVHGITGLVTDPLKGARREGTAGFFKGLGKGLIGVVAKPTIGVLDFTAKTLRGLGQAGESYGKSSSAKKKEQASMTLSLQDYELLDTARKALLLWSFYRKTTPHSLPVEEKKLEATKSPERQQQQESSSPAEGSLSSSSSSSSSEPGVSLPSSSLASPSSSSSPSAPSFPYALRITAQPLGEFPALCVRVSNDRFVLLATQQRLLCFQVTQTAWPERTTGSETPQEHKQQQQQQLTTLLLWELPFSRLARAQQVDNLVVLFTAPSEKEEAAGEALPPQFLVECTGSEQAASLTELLSSFAEKRNELYGVE